MSVQIFTGSKAYTTRKVRDLQKRGWKVLNERIMRSAHYGDQYTYRMEYIGMVQSHTGQWVSKS